MSSLAKGTNTRSVQERPVARPCYSTAVAVSYDDEWR